MASHQANSYEQDTFEECKEKPGEWRMHQFGMRQNGDYITQRSYGTEIATEYCNCHPCPLIYGTRVPGAPQN